MRFAQIDIPWLLFAGTAMMLLLVFTIVLFVIIHQRRVIKLQLELQKEKAHQQAQLIEAAVQSEELERKRISSELHDEVGALLSAIKLYFNQIQPAQTNNGKTDTLINCKELLDETIATVRNISVKLQPATIKDFGLEGTMQIFCDKLDKSSALSASLTVQGPLRRLDTEKELAIYRIIQELTNNILKHANASVINYSIIQKNGSAIQIFIEHNGDGLSQQEFEKKLYSADGLGLKNIQNRLNILKGSIRFDKGNNNMNNVFLQFPLHS